MTGSEGKRITGNHYPHSSGEGDPACLALPCTLTHTAAVIVPVTHQPGNTGISFDTSDSPKLKNFTPKLILEPTPLLHVIANGLGQALILPHLDPVPPNWSSCLQSTHYHSFSELLLHALLEKEASPVIPLLAVARAVVLNWRLPSTPGTQEQNCTFMPHGRGSE